jgi:hypothetical protein
MTVNYTENYFCVKRAEMVSLTSENSVLLFIFRVKIATPVACPGMITY